MDKRSEDVAIALKQVRSRLDSLGGESVRIIAVAKGFPIADVRAAMAAGADAVGENYAQEVLSKYSPVPREERPEIHFIGRLQRNKVAPLSSLVSTWQTVEHPRHMEAIARSASEAKVMIQVNTTGEEGKGGCSPSDTGSLVALGRSLEIDVIGLMILGPTAADRASTRAAFAQGADLKKELGLRELSMGMSGDLELAVEFGSTMVRIGSAIFGSRPPKS